MWRIFTRNPYQRSVDKGFKILCVLVSGVGEDTSQIKTNNSFHLFFQSDS